MDLAGARWRKSSFSSGGGDDNCVEVAIVPSTTVLRDSKNAAGPVLLLPTSAFRALLSEARRDPRAL
ncbi:MAG TPA: DUF397 domain-containing protein [Actinophytocola sp.]|uniref:DUF397 domain-containing protein n=1 Tax=Actinophytocola sp. TaxID=1872138 RepID=UPI002F9504B8